MPLFFLTYSDISWDSTFQACIPKPGEADAGGAEFFSIGNLYDILSSPTAEELSAWFSESDLARFFPFAAFAISSSFCLVNSSCILVSVSLPTQPARQVWVSHPRQPVLEATARGPGAGAACRTRCGPNRAPPLLLPHRIPAPTLGFLACAWEISSQPEASGPNVRPPRSLECPPHHHSLLCRDHPLDFPHTHRCGRVSHRASCCVSHLVLALYRLPVALLAEGIVVARNGEGANAWVKVRADAGGDGAGTVVARNGEGTDDAQVSVETARSQLAVLKPTQVSRTTARSQLAALKPAQVSAETARSQPAALKPAQVKATE
ncbi:hypothetical protein B0H14DRAFT_3485278 [Mycena olivaceomarginata]|nr:hypothetical protein B0H14DRAFT_3485278 [Mycena olivaceomarginata]